MRRPTGVGRREFQENGPRELAEGAGQGHRALLPCGVWRNLGVKWP